MTFHFVCRQVQYLHPCQRTVQHVGYLFFLPLLGKRECCRQILNVLASPVAGLAEVAGMCQSYRSCSVNEDTGLSLAYTVAHELGHKSVIKSFFFQHSHRAMNDRPILFFYDFFGRCTNSFGANHDGPTNGCEPLSGDQHVMSPQLSSDAGPIVWSNCSRKDITRFLDRNWGSCLEDPPSDHEFHYPELPPGAMYNVDHQCRLQYGPEAMHCAGMDEVQLRNLLSN